MEIREQESAIDLRDIFNVLRKRLWLILSITIIAAVIGGVYSFYFLKPVYESKISVVIGKTQENLENPQYDYSEIMMYQSLIKTYAEIARSRTVAQKTIDKLGLENGITPEILETQITVTPQADTQIMDLKVKDRIPSKSMDIVNALAASFIEESERIFPNGNVQTIDEAMIPKNPVSPNKKLNITIAFFLGLMVSLGLSFMLEYLDNTIKTEIDIEKSLHIPIIGIIPKAI